MNEISEELMQKANLIQSFSQDLILDLVEWSSLSLPEIQQKLSVLLGTEVNPKSMLMQSFLMRLRLYNSLF